MVALLNFIETGDLSIEEIELSRRRKLLSQNTYYLSQSLDLAFLNKQNLYKIKHVATGQTKLYLEDIKIATKKLQFFVTKLSDLEKKIQMSREIKAEIYKKINLVQSDLQTRRRVYQCRLGNMKRDSRMLTKLCVVKCLSDDRLSTKQFSYCVGGVPTAILKNSAETCLLKNKIGDDMVIINNHEKKLLEVFIIIFWVCENLNKIFTIKQRYR